jgi:ABC-type multidrug transport system ATPase subunit
LRYVNDQPLSEKSMLPAAFIEQDVNFFPHMTVKETLDFRVELKLGSRLGKSARDDVVNNLMDMLGLAKSANTIVGSTKVRGLSGGERKRLSIAVELISSPPVIILDEVSIKRPEHCLATFYF